MICVLCRHGDHQECMDKNVDRHPADCDCQHRTKQKTVVLESKLPTVEVLLPKVG